MSKHANSPRVTNEPQAASRPRPGGLTALAVLNFIFGGVALLAVFGMMALLNRVPDSARAIVGVAIVMSIGIAVLLILSAIGYLRQQKFLGRGLGSLYGVLGILSGIIHVAMLEQPVSLSTIISFIYPVLTLLLLITTFKDDFVNP